jgi:low temperature requirement protein LtrA
MYGRVWWHLEPSRPLVSGYLRGFSLDTALWAASIMAPLPWRYGLWLAAMTASVATPWLMRRVQVQSPLSTSHLPERFGLFTILVLGESIAAVVASLQPGAGTRGWTIAGAGLVVATGLWWVYFDNFDGTVVRRDPARRHDLRPTAWIYGHFPLTLCLVLVGSGMAHLAAVHDETSEHALVVVCGTGLAGALLSMALILVSSAGGSVQQNRGRAFARVLGALIVLGATFVELALSPATYLVVLALVLVFQVVVDVMLAGSPRGAESAGQADTATPAG